MEVRIMDNVSLEIDSKAINFNCNGTTYGIVSQPPLHPNCVAQVVKEYLFQIRAY